LAQIVSFSARKVPGFHGQSENRKTRYIAFCAARRILACAETRMDIGDLALRGEKWHENANVENCMFLMDISKCLRQFFAYSQG
jgi:hypothetical protein